MSKYAIRRDGNTAKIYIPQGDTKICEFLKSLSVWWSYGQDIAGLFAFEICGEIIEKIEELLSSRFQISNDQSILNV